VNWSASARRILSAGYDGIVRWIDPGTMKVERDVQAHQFWSWQSAVSPDGMRLASVTGQYRCGGYKYEPAAETEPSVKVFDTATGEQTHAFAHLPPVESVAFSNDGAHLAAGNLMGEVRIWELNSHPEAARISTPSFTGWGIIKGHYFTGGVFALAFAPDDSALYLAGMGSTTDPAAGNGKQLWERWAWRDGEPQRTGSANDGEIGQGLMESLAFHPSGKFFAMAGRLFKGDWNAAIFDTASGSRLAHENCGMRVSAALWSLGGARLYLAGGNGQPKTHQELENPDWGRLKVYEVVLL
jgi:WD40 repeat protein